MVSTQWSFAAVFRQRPGLVVSSLRQIFWVDPSRRREPSPTGTLGDNRSIYMLCKQQKVLAIMLRTKRNKWLRFDVDPYGEITSCIQLLRSFIARTPMSLGVSWCDLHGWHLGLPALQTSLNYVAECIWIHLNTSECIWMPCWHGHIFCVEYIWVFEYEIGQDLSFTSPYSCSSPQSLH